MKLRSLVGLLVLSLALALPALAAPAKSSGKSVDTVLDTAFNKPGQVNLNAGAILDTWGIGLDLGGEYIITRFDIPNFPMELGVAARAFASFPVFFNYTGINWGVAPMAMLHKGFNFGPNAQFDLYIGAGVGVGGSSWYTIPFGFGFATFDGVAWKLADKLWLQAEYGGVYGYGISTGMFSFGVRLEM